MPPLDQSSKQDSSSIDSRRRRPTDAITISTTRLGQTRGQALFGVCLLLVVVVVVVLSIDGLIDCVSRFAAWFDLRVVCD
jgi:hypothetical protein